MRQPLLHFLLLGALLFLIYFWIGDDQNTPTKEIVVTPGRIQTLERTFENVWQRPPTEAELNALIDDFISEEIYYREALAMGLDQDDTIVRRRMRQKMEFITADLAEQIDPTDEELTAFLDENRTDYEIEPVVSFKQVYLDPNKRKGSLEQEVRSLLEELQNGMHSLRLEELGDSIMLDLAYSAKSLSQIDRVFGSDFGMALTKLDLNSWQGPVQSGYGFHLVFVTDIIKARYPNLEEVRNEVVRDWTSAQVRETNERFIKTLRAQYTITIQDSNGE